MFIALVSISPAPAPYVCAIAEVWEVEVAGWSPPASGEFERIFVLGVERTATGAYEEVAGRQDMAGADEDSRRGDGYKELAIEEMAGADED